MSSITEITDSTFEQLVLKSDKPAVVDFWAPWCSPCRMMAPVFEKTAAANDGKVEFFKMNTDNNGKTPSQYSIMGIPSLIVFKNGAEVGRIVGMTTQENLQSALDKAL